MPRARFARATIAVVVAVILVDQVAKALVRRDIAPGSSVTVIDGVLRLVHARNSGIAGGLFAGAGTAAIIAISLAALSGLVVVARVFGPRRWLWLPLGLIVGGGLGNVIDRIRSGAVTDFIVFGHQGPANLADQAITLGIIGLLLVAWRSDRVPRAEEPDPPGRLRADGVEG